MSVVNTSKNKMNWENTSSSIIAKTVANILNRKNNWENTIKSCIATVATRNESITAVANISKNHMKHGHLSAKDVRNLSKPKNQRENTHVITVEKVSKNHNKRNQTIVKNVKKNLIFKNLHKNMCAATNKGKISSKITSGGNQKINQKISPKFNWSNSIKKSSHPKISSITIKSSHPNIIWKVNWSSGLAWSTNPEVNRNVNWSQTLKIRKPVNWSNNTRISPVNWSNKTRITPVNWSMKIRISPVNWSITSRISPVNWSINSLIFPVNTWSTGPPINWSTTSESAQPVVILWSVENKIRNNLIKSRNGNNLKVKSMKVVHWNLGSRLWINKTVEIQHLVDEYSPDLAIISEANLFLKHSNEQRHIEGYDIIVTKGFEHFGVSRLVVLAKEGMNVQTDDNLMDSQVASIWMKFASAENRKKLIIGAIYREHRLIGPLAPIGSETDSQQKIRWKRFTEQWRRASTGADVFVIGDTNIDLEKWNNPDQAVAPLVEILKTDIQTLGFSQIVEGITRSWPYTEDSAIDQVWTNSVNRVLQWSNLTRGVADHNLIVLIIRLRGHNIRPTEIVKRCWSKVNQEDYRDEVSKIDWSQIYKIKNPDLAYEYLESNLNNILDKMAPNKIIQIRKKYRNWVKQETKDKIKERETARNVARESKSEIDWQSYKVLRNLCTKMTNDDRKNYFKELYKEKENVKDIKSIYKITKQQLGWTTSGPPTALENEGKIIKKTKEIADCLIKHFKDKIEKIKNNLTENNDDPLETLQKAMDNWGDGKQRRPKFRMRDSTISETMDAMKKLGNNTAQGHDKLDAIAINAAASILAHPINHITNMSIQNGKFCNKWRIGKLIPLYKGRPNNPLSPTGYRPISILPVISKLVESQIQVQLLKFMEDTGQINPNTHAYRTLHGTTTAMLEISEELFEAADRKDIASIMTIDQTAAFDCVQPEILMSENSVSIIFPNTPLNGSPVI